MFSLSYLSCNVKWIVAISSLLSQMRTENLQIMNEFYAVVSFFRSEILKIKELPFSEC